MSVAKNVTQPKPIETESPSFTSAELDLLRDGLFFSCLISVIAAFVALFVYCLIRLRLSPTVGKRPMVILSLLVCICDGVYAAFNGATYFVTVEPPKGSPLCELLVWGYAFGSLLSLLMTCGIALIGFYQQQRSIISGIECFQSFCFQFLILVRHCRYSSFLRSLWVAVWGRHLLVYWRSFSRLAMVDLRSCFHRHCFLLLCSCSCHLQTAQTP
ncbi:hypothetical protein BKA69DRAFT_173639 [Paraphysoderma sedebokerense]|nr:hypothetical protein BKA69DRAFT_173639 [Paraphysoderma sedebokerense]